MIEVSSDKPLQDEVLLKVGRNMLNLQKFEGLLKELLAIADISGSSSEIYDLVQKNRKSLQKVTLGNLTPQYIEKVFVNLEEAKDHEEPDIYDVEPGKPVFGFRLSHETSVHHIESTKEALQILVSERNSLVHTHFTRFKPESDEDCFKMIDYLDQQHQRIEPHYTEVKQLLKSFYVMLNFVKDNPEVLTSDIDQLKDSYVIGDMVFTERGSIHDVN